MQSNVLSLEMLARIRALALEQAGLMDELEAALAAHDDARALGLARRLVDLEQQVKTD
jgi:hypothetical protein